MPELSKKLIYIEKNRSLTQHYLARDGATTLITNEPAYNASQWNDEKFRLLILFKYWNTIEYFYPYKYQTDQKWNDVLKEMITKFRAVNSEQQFHIVLQELTIKLCDSHAFFDSDKVRTFAGKKYIAAKFKILNDKAVIAGFYNDSLARLDDIRLGDVVTKVDGIPVSEIYARNEKYINGSNQAVKKLRYAFRWVFNGDTDSVRITFERDGLLAAKTVRRYERSKFKFESPGAIKWKLINGTIGYANMAEIQQADLPSMMKEFVDTQAIIFDLRNYPEFILDETLTYLSKEPRAVAKYMVPDLTYPGRFVWTEPVQLGKKNPSPYTGRVLILMNEETQSRAEYFVMALQTVPDAITIGRQTSGADGNVTDYTFFDENTTSITGLGVFYPDGRETQRIGIVPDVKVELTREDIRRGRDAILEKAIEIAKQR
jgi:C-terminal processing protease CtpA/Prc